MHKTPDTHMRIAFLSVLPPFRGGISSFGEHLRMALERHAEVSCVNYEVQYPDVLFPGKTQFLEANAPSVGVRILHPYNIFAWRRAIRSILATKPNVVVFAYWHPFFAPMLRFILKRLQKMGVKTCGIFHNVIAHEAFPFQHLLIKKLLSNTDLAITLSKATFDELTSFSHPNAIRLFHPVAEPITSTFDIDSSRWGKRISPDKPVLVHYGLIRKYKGVDVLLKALDAIPVWWEKCSLILAGENYLPESELFEGISEETKGRVIFENRFLPDSEVSALLSKASVLILPYRSASQSGIMAQAIANEKPVICSNLPGLLEYVVEGKTGWSFDSENATSLSFALDRFIAGKIEPDKTALTNQKHRYSWERFAEQVMDVI